MISSSKRIVISRSMPSCRQFEKRRFYMEENRNTAAFFFDPEQQEFPTFIHRYIWGKGVILMPP